MSIDSIRVKEIFLAAAELPDQMAQIAYLEKACGEDSELRARVEALLRSHDPASSFLGTPAIAFADSDVASQNTIDSALPANPHPTTHDDAEGLEFLGPPSRPDSLGRLGHYEVLQVLGKGGFGIVLRAFDDILQRVVAIKVMAPQMAATSPARKRFLREARSSAQVRHENVVQVYEVTEQPLPYLVMEFIPGETLQQRLDRKGPLEVQEILRIGRQIAEGLAAAHATDLIHRDIKPGNVLLEGGNQKVKITDFGLARAADDASMTQSGTIAGTPMYMAPEQASGQTLDQRADLFSLGSVLYQMASGRAPFRANTTIAVLKRVAEETPRNIREIIPETPQWLCDIISKLHAKDPNDRYQSAREVADVLANCEAQLKEYSKLKDLSSIPQRKATARVYGSWNWAAAVVLLFLLIGGIYFAQPLLLPNPVVSLIPPLQSPTKALPASSAASLPPTFTNSLGMEFVIVPKGKSWLGGGKGKIGDKEVTIPDDFYLGKYEVTQAEWEKVMGENPSSCRFEEPHRYPVETVSWEQCQLFLAKLNQLEKEQGWVYRLPKEVEWEYACRGGAMPDRANSAFDFYLAQPTNSLLPEHANFDKEETTQVGSYQPNALGLYDMHGNVHEWCLDDVLSDRAHKGGTWKYGADHCRAELTGRFPPAGASRHLGLRVARVRQALSLAKHGPPAMATQSSGVPPKAIEAPVCCNPQVFSPDGRWLVTQDHMNAARDDAIRVWDMTTGELRATLAEKPRRRQFPVFSPDGAWLAVQSYEPGRGFIEIVEIGTFTTRKRLPIPIPTTDGPRMAFNRTGKMLASNEGGVVTLWEVATGEVLVRLADFGTIHAVAFSPTADTLAVEEGVRSLQLENRWLLDSRIVLVDLDPQSPTYLKRLREWDAPDNGLTNTLAFTPDGSRLSFNRRMDDRLGTLVVDVRDGRIIHELTADRSYHETFLCPVASDGDTLVTVPHSAEGNRACVWNLATGNLERSFPIAANNGPSVAMSPSGRVLVLGGSNATRLQFYDTATGMELIPGIVRQESKTLPLGLGPFTDSDVQRIAVLPAVEQVEEVRKELKKRNSDFDGILTPTIENDVVTGLEFFANHVSDISPLRALRHLTALNCRANGTVVGMISDLKPLQGMQLVRLTLSVNPVSDLTPLEGMPLTELHIDNSQVADLSPLQGMPLKVLNCSYTKVASLAPLKESPLLILWSNNTEITDLSPLKGKLLEWVTIQGTKVTDISALKGMPLTQIYLDYVPARDRDTLRSFPNLQKINDLPPAEFWQKFEAKPNE